MIKISASFAPGFPNAAFHKPMGRSLGVVLVLASLLVTTFQSAENCLGQATLDFTGLNGFEYNFQLNSTAGPTHSGHFTNPFFGTASAVDIGSRVSSGTNASSAANWSLRADFSGSAGAADFRGFDVLLFTSTDSLTDVPTFGGIAGANSELSAFCDLTFTVATDQYYRMTYSGSGSGQSSYLWPLSSATANSFANDSIQNLGVQTRWNASVPNSGSLTANREITFYGLYQPGVQQHLQLGGVYGHSTTSGSALILGASASANTSGSSRYQMQLSDSAVGPSLAELSSREVRFLSGTYTLPALTANQTVNISVDGGSTLQLADNSA